jgi:hypothetical protein
VDDASLIEDRFRQVWLWDKDRAKVCSYLKSTTISTPFHPLSRLPSRSYPAFLYRTAKMKPQKNRSSLRGHSAKPYDEPAYQELEFTLSAKRQLSCAECRRLKRRCDRKWPCKSCISRGCASICPDGMLAAGSGSKFILHGSEELHQKISEMSDRISQLEDALSLSTGQSHPLLKSELLRIKLPPDTQNSGIQPDEQEDDKDDELGGVADEMGTLTLSAEGNASYMGRTAKIEVGARAN